MLTEERHAIILEMVNLKGSVKIGELCKKLNTSESTIRRDLNILSQWGKITKVHGGAIAIAESFTGYEHEISKKINLYVEEKEAIAEYAASLIEDGDFVFIDAGTTTGKVIDYVRSKNVNFVTNAFMNAKRLAQRGFTVFIPGGEIKPTTEAIVGAQCVLSLEKYNFTKVFMGANGISLSGGISTPDKNEAMVKSTVIERSKDVYVLADNSKFDVITPVRFAELKNVKIITDRLNDKKYKSETTVWEVL